MEHLKFNSGFEGIPAVEGLEKSGLSGFHRWEESRRRDYPQAPNEKFKADMLELFVEFFCQGRPLDLKGLIDDVEKCIILNALAKVNGNQKKAATILGIKYTTLNEKIKRFQIHFQKKPVAYFG